MPSKIWLHIGSEKTGSSSIQLFLAQNRAALAQRGFIVPVAAGRGNHVGLAAYALGSRVVNVLPIFGVRTDDQVAPFHARLEHDLAAETADPPDGAVVFSCELCSSRLQRREEVARLKQLCDRLAPQTTIVIYLRNQIDQLTSWYSTAIKGGSTKQLQWPPGPVGGHMLDYQAVLGLWADVFGHANIVARRFVSSDFKDGDVISDFAEVIGLDPLGLRRAPRMNSSLDVDCLAFLRAFNQHVPRRLDDEINPHRGPIVPLLESLSGASRLMVAPRIAAEVSEAYRASNAAVARDYFGGLHDPLFPAAKSVGASDADAELPNDPAVFARIAAELWRINMEKIEELEQDAVATRLKLRRLRKKLKAGAATE